VHAGGSLVVVLVDAGGGVVVGCGRWSAAGPWTILTEEIVMDKRFRSDTGS
jgi:hypothetical protein